MKKSVGSGTNTLFWLNVWWGDVMLKSQFPELFLLENNRRCFVSDQVSSSGFTWDWKADPCASHLNRNLWHLESEISSFTPNSVPDTWLCKVSSDGLYSIATLRQKLEESSPALSGVKTEWMKEVPLKIKCFIWRAKWEKIPSADALTSRGVNIASTKCGYCQHNECVDHIFIQCDFATRARNEILKWCGINLGPINTVMELLEFISKWATARKNEEFLR